MRAPFYASLIAVLLFPAAARAEKAVPIRWVPPYAPAPFSLVRGLKRLAQDAPSLAALERLRTDSAFDLRAAGPLAERLPEDFESRLLAALQVQDPDELADVAAVAERARAEAASAVAQDLRRRMSGLSEAFLHDRMSAQDFHKAAKQLAPFAVYGPDIASSLATFEAMTGAARVESVLRKADAIAAGLGPGKPAPDAEAPSSLAVLEPSKNLKPYKSLSFESMQPRHRRGVLKIEEESFDTPWGWDDFQECWDKDEFSTVVARRGGQIVGYLVYQATEKGIRLLNFAVAKKHRRRGAGRLMMDWLKGQSEWRRLRLIVVEVREKNVLAQVFHRAMGFKWRKTKKNFYEATAEDAYLLRFVAPPLPKPLFSAP